MARQRRPADEVMDEIATSIRASAAALDEMHDMIRSTRLDTARTSRWLETLAKGQHSMRQMRRLLRERLAQRGPDG